MGFRHSMALNFSPLLLRVALGVTFFYAGWGKMLEKSEFAPEQLAVLANMGFGAAKDAAAGSPAPVEAAPLERAPERADPQDELPEPGRVENPAERSGGRAVLVRQATTTSARVYRASDFDKPAELSRTHFIGLALHSAANPADGKRRLLPKALAERPWGWALSHGAAITEFVGGILIFIGLMTRLAALGLTVVMGMAIWLTTIGPSLGASGAFLGVLPPVGAFQSTEWQTWLLQLALFCSAAAVLFSGPGAISLDGVILGRRASGGADAEDEEEE
ncbi:MAG: DoxX family protein [Phycisphaerales bacterium]|nr:DoxX family protein [Phycisphaerales bacterium]